ncbi:hypothetical protein COO60DRAFT_8958 [Scenedesmus sp. NREL 46B-D3]|nr:hypothetical protein COO60DRAFT_8958 [Scenedesmus sp. NREL 46B-D3]
MCIVVPVDMARVQLVMHVGNIGQAGPLVAGVTCKRLCQRVCVAGVCSCWFTTCTACPNYAHVLKLLLFDCLHRCKCCSRMHARMMLPMLSRLRTTQPSSQSMRHSCRSWLPVSWSLLSSRSSRFACSASCSKHRRGSGTIRADPITAAALLQARAGCCAAAMHRVVVAHIVGLCLLQDLQFVLLRVLSNHVLHPHALRHRQCPCVSAHWQPPSAHLYMI